MTAVAPVNPDPEMPMVSPPPAVPLDGVRARTDTGLVPLPELPLVAALLELGGPAAGAPHWPTGAP